jgi:hypothetical protein
LCIKKTLPFIFGVPPDAVLRPGQRGFTECRKQQNRTEICRFRFAAPVQQGKPI